MKKRWAILLVFMLTLALLTGCSGDPATPADGETTEGGATTSNGEKIVRVTVSGTPVIDPHRGNDNGSSIAMINIYEALVWPGADGAEPLLAESWEANEAGTEFTFKLKQGVPFHTGGEMKASDVVFSANRMMTMGEGFGYIYADSIDKVEAVDDYTVKFTLKQPFGAFVESLPRLSIMSEEAVMANANPDGPYGEFGDYGRDWLVSNDAGTGPYVVKELIQQGHLYATKFEDWHGEWEADAPESFRLIDNTESSTVRTMMSTKELEITDMWQSPENLDAMSQLDGVEIATYSTYLMQYMHMNTKKAPTDDINFRRALACLLDYDTILENVYMGSTRATGPVNSYTAGAVDTNVEDYNIEKAKEYIAQSKYADTYQDYTIEMICNTDIQKEEKLCLAFQAAASQVGLKVEISKVPWVTIQERISNADTTPNMITLNSGPQYNEAGAVLESYAHSKTCGTYENVSWLQNDDLDARIEDALATLDHDERFEKYAEIQNYIVDEFCPGAFLANLAEQVAYQSSYLEWPAIEQVNGELATRLIGYHYYFPDMKLHLDKK